MQIFSNLLGVIFVLSTIVVVTDCCSSRILLLRERALRIVRQQKFYNQAQAQQQQQHLQLPAQEKMPQHLDIPTEMDFNKNYSSEHVLQILSEDNSNESTDDDAANLDLVIEEEDIESLTEITETTDDTLEASIDITASDDIDIDYDDATLVVVTTPRTKPVPSLREQNAGNPKYHVIDFYYTLMRDVLSLECSGSFLTDFCLNGGRCFRYPVGSHSFFSCECADGYVGERCESKSLNELYMPITAQPTKVLAARIIFTFPMLIALSAIYLLFGAIIVCKAPRQQEQRRFAAAAAMFAC